MNIWVITRMWNSGLGYDCDVMDVVTDEEVAKKRLIECVEDFIDGRGYTDEDVVEADSKYVEIEHREPQSEYMHAVFRIHDKELFV